MMITINATLAGTAARLAHSVTDTFASRRSALS